MKRWLSVCLALLFVLAPAVPAAETEAIAEATAAENAVRTGYSVTYPLSDGLTLTRNICESPSDGPERTYLLEYTPGAGTQLSFVTGEKLRKPATIASLAAVNFPDRRFVAGINADFFNMSTGVPESALVIDGRLYTSDRGGYCLVKKADGTYEFAKPQISLVLTDEKETAYTVLSLNKEFTQYGLYLYDSNFAVYTNVFTSNTTAVLRAYEDVLSWEEMCARFPETVQSVTEEFDAEMQAQPQTEPPTETAEDAPEEVPEITEEERERIREETERNVQAEREKRVAAALEKQSGYTRIGEDFYLLAEVCPRIGQPEKLVVCHVNADAGSAAIRDGAYMLCADNSSYGYLIMAMYPGERLTLDIRADEAFADVTDAVGTGAVIVHEAKALDDRNLSHYTTLQPRSAVGIKEDGTLVFCAVDGRRKGVSVGMKILTLGEYLVSLGCVEAANFDGGGSTAVRAFLPAGDKNTLVNKPSEGSERAVSTAVVFTDTRKRSETPAAADAYFFGDAYVTYNDCPIELGAYALSDENGFSVAENEQEPVNVSLYAEDGIVADNVYYPLGAVGFIPVYALVGNEKEGNTATTVVSLAEPDSINITVGQNTIKPFESTSVSVGSLFCGLPVGDLPTSYLWRIAPTKDEDDENNENVTEEDGQTTVTRGETGDVVIESEYGVIRDGIFVPKIDGVTLSVSASRGEKKAEARIFVKPYPFADMKGHWAEKEIFSLAEAGVVNGELDENGVAFYLPERTYSRHEFFTMLWRLTDIGDETDFAWQTEEIIPEPTEDGEETVPEEETEPVRRFTDLADADEVPDWAFEAAVHLYQNGLLDAVLHTDGEGAVILDGDAPVTRAEVIDVMGRVCRAAPADYVSEPYADLTPEQADDPFIKNALYAGIFSGYEDKTLRLDRFLSRAEAAAVFARLSGVFKK